MVNPKQYITKILSTKFQILNKLQCSKQKIQKFVFGNLNFDIILNLEIRI